MFRFVGVGTDRDDIAAKFPVTPDDLLSWIWVAKTVREAAGVQLLSLIHICLGGAIRDPLSGRTYVYQAMRVTGAADPTVSVKDTLPGKLPQKDVYKRQKMLLVKGLPMILKWK